ncbi:A/G-specific adenine glycosylase [Colletotrichum karsti]|uniref:A/G-specific adenine glycosylase n=1 Tax=Colletotrichum karsti TaxID=1095194 RepID=A0A9P6I389_9PEZI|nr:A/G-specific adenine glycosylase [Colletotrichum karsti]KAF9876117.1 A/G-specific adenine glycosylase [Colletotrichum karsti]
MRFLASALVMGGAWAGALASALDNDKAYRCGWNPLGHFEPSDTEITCPLPFNPNTAVAWSPWTHRPVCTSSKTTLKYCAFVKDNFRGDSGILILTSPEVAAGDFSQVEDFDPRSLDSGPLSVVPETPPFEVQEIPGKGLGAVALSKIRAGEVIAREHPKIMQIASEETFRAIDRGEALWVLEEGFVRLPVKDQVKVFELARSTGGHVLEDIIRTNTFGVTFNNVSHYALFPEVARINHACRPNSITRFSPRTLALEVVAYRDILPGEELSISYSPLNMDYKDRQQTLAEWGFKCNCSLCSSPDAVAASDANRERIQQIVSMLNQPVFQNPGLMKQLGEEMEGIIEKEKLRAQLGDFYDMFARAYVRMGEWIASASCTAAVFGYEQKGCKGAHVVVSRRQVCEDATEPCICFFGSCGNILTLFAENQDSHATVLAPCEKCGVDEDPHQMLLMKIFDNDFAKEWVEYFGHTHWKLCTEDKWLGIYESDGVEAADENGDENGDDTAEETDDTAALEQEDGASKETSVSGQ